MVLTKASRYVYPGTFGVVYLCNAFWSAPNAGTDSRGGTLIHESSHFTANGGTNDVVYGITISFCVKGCVIANSMCSQVKPGRSR